MLVINYAYHVFVLPPDPPSAPQNLNVTDVGKTHMCLKWTPPKQDGGSFVTEYIIDTREVGNEDFKETAKIDGNVCDYKVDGLQPGKQYQFSVLATNPAGVSVTSAKLESPVSTKPPFGELSHIPFCFCLITIYLSVAEYSSLISV